MSVSLLKKIESPRISIVVDLKSEQFPRQDQVKSISWVITRDSCDESASGVCIWCQRERLKQLSSCSHYAWDIIGLQSLRAACRSTQDHDRSHTEVEIGMAVLDSWACFEQRGVGRQVLDRSAHRRLYVDMVLKMKQQ